MLAFCRDVLLPAVTANRSLQHFDADRANRADYASQAVLLVRERGAEQRMREVLQLLVNQAGGGAP